MSPLLLRNTKTPQGTETINFFFHCQCSKFLLRNTKTPQGTETLWNRYDFRNSSGIEKYEDPAGDGNPVGTTGISKCSRIEKYEDPAGDGNP